MDVPYGSMEGHPEAVVDLAAIRANVAAIAAHVGSTKVMAVVKSDGYGHGMIPTAAAALAGGATWIATNSIAEAAALRRAGIAAPLLCLLTTEDGPHAEAIELGIDLGVGSVSLLRRIVAAVGHAGRRARVHLKADTGMSRGGATMADWPRLVTAAAADSRCEVVGIWSHLACADVPGHPSVDAQLAAFRAALDQAERAGIAPSVTHLANTPALLTRPDTWFDLVRPGGGVTGLCTLPGGPPGWLRPAMTVRTEIVQVKRVPPGTGVSYGHRYVTSAPATLGLMPLGYNEGIPRAATNTAQVLLRGRRVGIAGTVCMNQCVLDAGDDPVEVGDKVVLFGPGDQGEPTAQEWADRLGTLSYDIVTRFTAKIPRSYCGVTEAEEAVVRAVSDGLVAAGGTAGERVSRGSGRWRAGCG